MKQSSILFEQEEELCELWDDEPVPMQTHSRLYHLEPIGVGSPMVESLTSYVVRLAGAHSVYPRVLFIDEILPHLNLPYICQNGRTQYGPLTTWWQQSAPLNGTNKSTRNFVQVLAQLTARSDLQFLTMLFWAEVLPSRGLLKRTRAWCPICYEEWQHSGSVVYDPLFWSLEVITTCPLHRQRLQQHCFHPNCQRTIPHLAPRAQPGHCPWCNCWLGCLMPGKEYLQRSENGEWEYQQWISKAVGELLSACITLPISPKREKLTENLQICVEKIANGNISAFARQIQVDPECVSGWVQGSHIPIVGTFLQICFYLGVQPLDFFIANEEEIFIGQKQNTRKSKPPEISSRRYRKFETERLRNTLEAILQYPPEPPLSMRKIAKNLEYDAPSLWRKFPDLCQAISAHYLACQTQKRQERVQKSLEEVRQAVLNLHEQGRYPSSRQVGYLLKKPGALQNPEVYAAWKSMLKDLGWQER